MSKNIYRIGKCDYCSEANRITRPTPFMADGTAMMCKDCWDMTEEEYAASEGTYIGKFEDGSGYEDIQTEHNRSKKIYIASSWKNVYLVRTWAEFLRSKGFEVDDFTDNSRGRYVFYFADICNPEETDAIQLLQMSEAQKAFDEDKKWIDWADVVFLLLPAGKSSHLEAGYAKGQEKKLIIFQEQYPKGEFDVMYGFADLLTDDPCEVIEFLRTI